LSTEAVRGSSGVREARHQPAKEPPGQARVIVHVENADHRYGLLPNRECDKQG
jgi:hypothetical protein